MLTLRLYGKKNIKLTEIPIPEINRGEILLKTDAVAVCGTDVRIWQNGAAGVDADHPVILGHEFSGTIVKIGRDVPFYKENMKVGIQPNIGCGICDRCVSGNFHLCENYRAFGINIDGAFAEYVRIPSEAIIRGNLSLLPDGMSSEEAAIIEPLSCAYNGFSKCNVKPGEFALVVGAGSIGIMHAMLLHMAGTKIIMNDISEERLQFCKELMPYVTTYFGDDLAGFVRKQTEGNGLDIAITACSVPSVQTAMPPLMNYGGRIIIFGGVPADKQPVSIDTNLIHYRELCIIGSTRSNISQYRRTMEFVAKGLIDAEKLITHSYKLTDVIKAFENAQAAKGIKHVIKF